MITWPIFLAFFLAVIAVYISIKLEDAKENKKQQDIENEKIKIANLEKRKDASETINNTLKIS
ncbi:MAG: hypothetical protein PF484_12340 [Bacteroidales bacterium]|jgi:hypothetical protein|nr:hypothetical protein [Bacteroidales bacterium]